MKRGIALGWVFLWTARPQRRALQLFQTKYPTSKIFNYGECSEKRENMPLAGASPLAWLLATPPNGELARRLEKMTKARQIPGGGGRGQRPAIMIYPVELWNPCDFRRFPTTFRKRRNVQISVPKTFEHFRSYFKWFLSKRTQKKILDVNYYTNVTT